MPKRDRLTHAELAALPRGGARRYPSTYFSLSVTPLGGKTRSQAVCVVSKKVAAHAVGRNRIKRRVRSVLSGVLPKLKQPYALVFTARSGVARASFPEIRDDIQRLLMRVE